MNVRKKHCVGAAFSPRHDGSAEAKPQTDANTDRAMLCKQALAEKIRNECSFLHYPSIYMHHCLQLYLQKMPPDIWIPLIKIRTSNHKLPVQFYSWNIVFKPREERTCTICGSGEVGDELHYILHCEVFKDERNKFLPSTRNNKSLENFVNLLKSDKISILRGLAKFLNIVFGVFE